MHKFKAAVLAFSLAMAAMGAMAADKLADEAALREIKEVLWPHAYATNDTKLLDRILADEFQTINEEGGWSTKAEEMAWVAKNRPSYDSLTFAIRRLDIFENGTAVVAGSGTVRGKDKDGPYVLEYQSSNIFIKRKGAWQAVASHISGARKIDPQAR